VLRNTLAWSFRWVLCPGPLLYSRESLTEKAAEIEKMIFVKEHEKERHDFDPAMFYENRFWNQRSDGIMSNKNHQTQHILEFKGVI